MSSTSLVIRYIEPGDIAEALSCVWACRPGLDDDFGVPVRAESAWGRAELLDAIRDTNTRTYVVEAAMPATDDSVVSEFFVCGVMVYDIRPEAYEVLLLAAHPRGPVGVAEKMLNFVKSKANRSDTRNKVRCVVPDGDYSLLKSLQDNGYAVRLKPGAKNDEWVCVLDVSVGVRAS